MCQLHLCNAGETISMPKHVSDSLSGLDIVWSDMFETINPDRARRQQANFLKGAPPTWLNVHTPLVERDGFNELKQLIERRKEKHCLITDVCLRCQPGSGGSTLGMQVLWHFRRELRCARVIESEPDSKALSKQVVDLFLLGKEQSAEQDGKTVLLLLDTKEKTDNDLPIKDVLWENLIEEIHSRGIDTSTPVVIILDCSAEDFSLKDTLTLASKLSEEEIKQFKEKLLQQIRLQKKSHWKLATINLLYHKDSSGLTLVREQLQDVRDEFTWETLTIKDEFEREIENKTDTLFDKYKTHSNNVILLLDHKEDETLQYLLKRLQLKLERDRTECPGFIIISAVEKIDVRAPGHVKLKLELLPHERDRFAQKRQEVEQMSKNFHAFNIMQGGFQREDAEKVITGEMANLMRNGKESGATRLLRFLDLINSYVPGSHLSKPLCKKFIEETEWRENDEGKPSVEMIMKPFMDLIVVFSDGKQKANCIRLAHPMIADACLKTLGKETFDIALDFLSKMVKENERNYEQICKRMLVTRLEGLVKREKFSRLILVLIREDHKQCIQLLETALNVFSTDPFYPQALARLYYIEVTEENKYEKAEKWAEEAIKRDRKKSYIIDTLGQVHKNHLRSEVKKKNCKEILCIAKSAIDAFKREEKAAEDELDGLSRFNNRGHFGFLQVSKDIKSPTIPIAPSELQKYCAFTNRLRDEVELKYDFFERYLAFSRPSKKKEEPDYFHRDVEECYRRYFTEGEQNLNEKKKKSFGGLLHFLKSDISVLKQSWSAIEKPKSEAQSFTS